MGNIVCNPVVTNIGDIICKIGSLLNLIVPVLVALGVVYFIWGVVTYFIGDSEEAKKRGKNQIIYGIIGFVVIFALDGLMFIVINTFGLYQGAGIVSNLVQNNSAIIAVNSSSSSACNLSSFSDPKLGDLLNFGTCLINNSIIPLIFALAVVMFIWGVIQYVINSDEEAKKEKGKQFMIWGIIGLAVMVGVWGLVHILGATFNINYAIPQVR